MNDFFDYLMTNENCTEQSIKLFKCLKLEWFKEFDFSSLSIDDIGCLLRSKVTSYHSMKYIYRLLLLYLNYTGCNQLLYEELNSIGFNEFCMTYKPKTSKFISHSEFLEICKNIDTFEEYNELYQLTLFQSIYEGIYCGDYSVLYNLRASDVDVNNNTVTLRNSEDEVYTIPISSDLANNLIALSREPYWYSRNRNCDRCEHRLYGDYVDSCLKTAYKNGETKNRKYSYYRIIKKIANEYTDKNLSSRYIFISGLIQHIKLELQKNDLTLDDAFSRGRKNKMIHSIISEQILKYKYSGTVSDLRKYVNGFIDDFKD